jgi:hypothetical protein
MTPVCELLLDSDAESERMTRTTVVVPATPTPAIPRPAKSIGMF